LDFLINPSGKTVENVRSFPFRFCRIFNKLFDYKK